MVDDILQHKDDSPENTILLIRSILNSLNIYPIEKNWEHVNEICFSVNLLDPDYPVSTNGKGMTPLFALASAYGEYIERVQNGVLYGRNYGKKVFKEFSFPDEKTVRCKDILNEHSSWISNVVNINKVKLSDFISNEPVCVPFYYVKLDKVTYLPLDLLLKCCSSTGMCAGNSTEEALVQGICEIMERYAKKQIFCFTSDAPTIPLSSLKNYYIYKTIIKIQNYSFHLIIKDCSLNGQLPVIAIVFFNETKNKYKITFGSDPIFEVALQRCITEFFQGYNTDTSTAKMLPLSLDSKLKYNDKDSISQSIVELIKHNRNGSGEIPLDFIFATGEPKHDKAFMRYSKDNKKMLLFLLRKIKAMQYQIFIRNVSFLGFPTYQIFIPEMSAENKIDAYSHISDKKRNHIRNCLLNIKKVSKKDIIQCLKNIEDLMTTSASADIFLIPAYKYFTSLRLANTLPLATLNLNYLLSLLSLYICNYQKAFYYFNSYLKTIEQNHIDINDQDYAKCVLFCLKLKTENKDDELIKEILYNIFNENLVNQVINDISNPDNTFQYIELPECGNCDKCKITQYCKFNKWFERNQIIYKKINEKIFDQTQVADHL